MFFVLGCDDGTNRAIPLGSDEQLDEQLLERLQRLSGFDSETFIRAMAVSDEGISVLLRR